MTGERKENKRPTGLMILVVLTVLHTVYRMISTISAIIVGNSNEVLLSQKQYLISTLSFMKKYDPQAYQKEIETSFIYLDAVFEKFVLYQSFSLFIYTLGLIGCIYMYRGFKIGFHVYIIYSFLAVIQDYLILKPSQLQDDKMITYGLVSLIFIFLYSRYLHWMKPTNLESED